MDIDVSLSDAVYDEFLADMKEVEDAGECRYCIYDMPYEARGQLNHKLVLISW